MVTIATVPADIYNFMVSHGTAAPDTLVTSLEFKKLFEKQMT